MIYVYTDGSFREGAGAHCVVAVTRRTLVGYKLDRYEAKSSTQCELLALIDGLELINKQYNTPQVIKFYCDCESVVRILTRVLNEGKCSKRLKEYELFNKFLEMSRGHQVRISYTEGHRVDRNLNLICDMSARTLVRL